MTKNKRVLKLTKRALIIFIVALTVLGTVACGKPPIQSGILEEDYVIDIEGNITFTISNESGTAAEAAAPKAIASAFMKKYPDVTVEVEEANRDTYATRISTGEIGDVFWCDENDANNYKKNHNALMMLDYYLEKLDIDKTNVYNGALAGGLIDGRLYMVPRNLGQQVLVYNKDALKQASIEIPQGETAMTWDEFKEVCRQVTLQENDEYTQVGAGFKLWWSPVWMAFAEGWGGTWASTSEKKVSFVSDENVMKGIDEMFEACAEGWMMIEDINYTDGRNYQSIPEYNRVFRTFGDMQWITRYGNGYDLADIDWDFCSFPAFPTHKVGTGATGYVVYNRTTNPTAAAAFALFFLTEDGQRAYHSAAGGNVPLLKSLAYEDFWQMPDHEWSEKNFSAFISYPEASTPASVITRAPAEIASILSDENMRNSFTQIVNGQKSTEDVFTKLETQCNEMWETLTS